MNVFETKISGLLIIEPQVFADERGYFLETFNLKKYKELGMSEVFVQDNESFSKKNVIRGLHLQLDPMAQGKLARVIKGVVLDVAVDCRPDSKTYGQYESVILSGENEKQFWIPRGFAHGLSVLSKEAIFCYKCDNYYSKDHEIGILFNDPDLKIDWQVKKSMVSEKDRQGIKFQDLKKILLRSKK